MISGPIRILLIEDNSADFYFIKELIGKDRYENFTLDRVSNLADGLDKLKMTDDEQKGNYDIVLLDLGLPDSMGLETLENLRDKCKYIPIVVLTGLDDELTGSKAIRLGAQDYLIKYSIDEQLLIRSIRYSLERKYAEESERISIERYKILFDKMIQGAIYYDTKGRVISFNSAALKILNITNIQMAERTVFDTSWRAIHEDGSPFQSSEYPAAIALKQGVEVSNEVIGLLVSAPDDYRWINVSAMPLFNSGEGKPFQAFVTFEDITEQKKKEDLIKKSLKEKEILIKEIHHRVKNNLQIISSLLSLQADYVEDEKALELFTDSKNRIRAMAMIHEKLYQTTNFSEIDFGEYTAGLIHYLNGTYGIDSGKIRTRLEVDDVLLTVEIAIPCGLIINELLSNSFKYAFPDSGCGNIAISFSLNGRANYQLIVEDDGIGIPKDIISNGGNTLGFTLVDSLVKQLKGSIQIENSKGTKIIIQFPVIED